jgi:hypothetical protein
MQQTKFWLKAKNILAQGNALCKVTKAFQAYFKALLLLNT